MAFSPKQAATAWACMAVMVGMMIYPPWFWDSDHQFPASPQYGAGYAWVWSPPPAPDKVVPAGESWEPVIYWDKLLMQWLFVGVGMALLLLLREARERRDTVDKPGPSPAE